jgi:hypothetical protein
MLGSIKDAPKLFCRNGCHSRITVHAGTRMKMKTSSFHYLGERGTFLGCLRKISGYAEGWIRD